MKQMKWPKELQKTFAKYWIHNGLVKVNGQKMSKSLNNSIFLKDVLDLYPSDVIKMLILSNSYRSDLNVVDGMFDTLENKIFNIYKLFAAIDAAYPDVVGNAGEYGEKIKAEFTHAMDNDFNTALAIANMNKYISDLTAFFNKKTQTPETIVGVKQTLVEVYGVLRLLGDDPSAVVTRIREKYLAKNNITVAEIEPILAKWNEARLAKDFATADKYRAELLSHNVAITLTNGEAGFEVTLK